MITKPTFLIPFSLKADGDNHLTIDTIHSLDTSGYTNIRIRRFLLVNIAQLLYQRYIFNIQGGWKGLGILLQFILMMINN